MYQVVSSWSGQFQGQVTVRNTGTAPTKSWTVAWTFSGGVSLSQTWGGDASASNGSQILVKNLSYNGALAGGATTTFGFIANGSGSSSTPTAVTCTSS